MVTRVVRKELAAEMLAWSIWRLQALLSAPTHGLKIYSIPMH